MTKTEITLNEIRKIMIESNINIKELSQRINKSQSATSGLLRQNNISIEMLDTICQALGYEIEINFKKKIT